MKKLKFLGMAAAGLVLLTSCMKGDNKYSNTTYGTVELSMKAMRTLVYPLGDYPLFISEIANASLEDEACIYFQYSVDADAAENANAAANGFYVAQTSKYRVVKSGYLDYMSDTDTSTVLPRELLFTEAGVITLMRTNEYKKYKLVVGANHEKLMSKQENDYFLSWNQNKAVEMINGNRVYTMFLRAVKRVDGEAPSGVGAEDRAFDITNFYNQVQSTEENAGKDKIYIKITYPKELASDSLSIKKWVSTDPVGLPIVKDQQ